MAFYDAETPCSPDELIAYADTFIYKEKKKCDNYGASFKTSHFGRSLRWAKILILEILHVFLRLKFSPALALTKLKRFESGSMKYIFTHPALLKRE
ncbi:MAG: hypothetical protein FP814_05085 [Desulfobacterium sp.]|nr:hypothetical protein [Desulfobacterium sp.]